MGVLKGRVMSKGLAEEMRCVRLRCLRLVMSEINGAVSILLLWHLARAGGGCYISFPSSFGGAE